jgi:hypothetical protein
LDWLFEVCHHDVERAWPELDRFTWCYLQSGRKRRIFMTPLSILIS